MQSNSTEEQSGESVPDSPFVRGLSALRHSLVLTIAVLGVLLVAIGASPFVSGVFAGMFGIWGATALICAGLGYLGVKLLELFDKDD